MKTSCNVHPLARETSSERRMLLGSWREKQEGRSYQVLSEEQQVGPAKVCLSGSTGGGSSGFLSLGKKQWVTGVTKRQPLYIAPIICYDVCIKLLYSAKAYFHCNTSSHGSLYAEKDVQTWVHFPPGSQIRGDVPWKQLPLSATVHCQHLPIQNTPQVL